MSLQILLVDDELASLRALESFLTFEFEVFTAGPDNPVPVALRLWREKPDLQCAIVDLKMPSADGGAPTVQAGLNLIAQLKMERKSARVAARSAFETHDILAEAAKIGADGFQAKDWVADDVLANVNLIAKWVTMGPLLRALAEGIERRIPRIAGHGERVRDLCRALVIYLDEANPKTFDLTACLLAAEMHDLGMVAIPDEVLLRRPGNSAIPQHDLLDRHVDFASALRSLGPGFAVVERIIALHHHSYRRSELSRPGHSQLPQHTPDIPYGDSIPLEARTLRLADAVDNLLTSVPAYDLATSLELVQEHMTQGVFDPRVVNALNRLVAEDRERFETIYRPHGLPIEVELALFYWGERTTVGLLQECLLFLAGIHVQSGRAADRLTVVGIEKSTFQGRPALKVRLLGDESDTATVQRILGACQQPGTRSYGYLDDRVAWEPRPDGIERTPVPVP